MKGAPEKILKNCSTIFIDGCEVEFNEFWKREYQKAFKELSKKNKFNYKNYLKKTKFKVIMVNVFLHLLIIVYH
jgi:hypothetical protein